MFGLSLGLSVLLVLCILCVCVFEFINGFHDTANAVATVIYTKSLKPWRAVMLSGLLNGLGVFMGGTAVAMGIINMLPVETLVDQNITHSLGMVGAILLTAIIWNLGTWMMAIPASSSHTLVGAILGVGIAYSLLPGTGDAAVNWHKASEVGLSLLCSPLFGFLMAMLLMSLMARLFVRRLELFKAPEGDTPPPWWVRGTLIATCGLVSFSHGSNDGQKGIGLMMLILIGIVPAQFSLDSRYGDHEIAESLSQVQVNFDAVKYNLTDAQSQTILQAAAVPLAELTSLTNERSDLNRAGNHRFEIRKNILLLRNEVAKLKGVSHAVQATSAQEGSAQEGSAQEGSAQKTSTQKGSVQALVLSAASLRRFTDYAPLWVIVLIALSLGIGTMIGWERIVITIGEKIGKTHLSYAQGASAEMVAASTIAASTYLGLPVSTTHVLSSGIAGAMYSSGGLSNLDKVMIQKILMAWVLTFPVCVTLSGTLFLVFRSIFE